MERTLNRAALFTFLSFLVAPAVPALAALLTSSPIKTAVPFAAAAYVVAFVIAAPIAVPAFFMLRRYQLVNWWSATFTGALPPLIVTFAFGRMLSVDHFAFGALGGLSGFVFWLIWRMGHRDRQITLTATGAPQASTTVGTRLPNATIYALAVIAVFLSAWGWAYWQVQQEMKFDAVAWREGVRETDRTRTTRRQRMADGLLRSNMLRGKTRAEVEALLGPDSKSDYFREYDLVYWLGAERGYFGIDSEWLVIKFASDGQVADVRLVTD